MIGNCIQWLYYSDKWIIKDVHIDLNQIYDAFGESYCVQSVKASCMESIDMFLRGYSDHQVIYSKNTTK